jgi:hypothetical protein
MVDDSTAVGKRGLLARWAEIIGVPVAGLRAEIEDQRRRDLRNARGALSRRRDVVRRRRPPDDLESLRAELRAELYSELREVTDAVAALEANR